MATSSVVGLPSVPSDELASTINPESRPYISAVRE